MEKFFHLKEYGTNVSTEVIAGFTTFFAMCYILFVNPTILEQTGIPFHAVFLATIISSVIGTLIMGLYANVPYAQAPGMGLNAFFTYTVVFALGFTWQEALAMVFICGVINIIVTVTKLRKMIILSIPPLLQQAIGGGIGIFIAYLGIKNAGLLQFTADPGTYTLLDSGTVITSAAAVPGIVTLNAPAVLLFLIGLTITIVLLVKNVKGAILIGILATTLLGIPFGVVDLGAVDFSAGYSSAFADLGTVFGQAFSSQGMGSLFSDPAKIPLVLMTIFAFSMTDMFDTIGTLIGTGRKSGIFSVEEEEHILDNGMKSRMDRALFADSVATSIGAICGTSNVTTYVESAAGIGAGGRTGLTSVVVSLLFIASIFIAPIAGLVPAAATAPALILVGIMMMSSFSEIDWNDFSDAVPAFFAGVFMALCYSISYGIAASFIFYCVVKIAKGQAKEIHPMLWVVTGLFILNFVMLAVI